MSTGDRLGVREDLVDANRILVRHGILDAFGHVSVRDPDDPSRFLISRNLAPGLVTPDDIQVIGLDGTTADDRPSYLERFIHGEIYRARADVQAVVHSHSASMVPFSISRTPLQAVWHMAGFLGEAVPVFEIRDSVGSSSDLLIRSGSLGADLAATLGGAAVARAVYADLNARAQVTAGQLGGYTALTAEEGAAAAESNNGQLTRAWEIWRANARRGESV